MDNVEWVAGLLEGEGSFMAGPPSQPNQPLLTVCMTDKDVLDRLAESLGGVAVVSLKSRQAHWKQAWRVTLGGGRAMVAMKEIYPHMGERRKGQIDKALNSYRGNIRGKTTPAQREQAVKRLDSGESAIALAEELEVTKWAIYRMRDASRREGSNPSSPLG